jgi:predicted ester cyclase
MTTNEIAETKTRARIERLYDAFARHDLDMLRNVVTPDWEYIPEPKGAKPGPDQMASIFQSIAAALPDMKIDIHDVLIHGNRVGVRAEVTGTQAGPLMGIAATSKPVRFAIHSFHEMRGELVAKTWHLEDWLGVFLQLGELPRQLDLRE